MTDKHKSLLFVKKLPLCKNGEKEKKMKIFQKREHGEQNELHLTPNEFCIMWQGFSLCQCHTIQLALPKASQKFQVPNLWYCHF